MLEVQAHAVGFLGCTGRFHHGECKDGVGLLGDAGPGAPREVVGIHISPSALFHVGEFLVSVRVELEFALQSGGAVVVVKLVVVG